jgi:hypothetical protein
VRRDGRPYEAFVLDFAQQQTTLLTLRRNRHGYFTLTTRPGPCHARE